MLSFLPVLLSLLFLGWQALGTTPRQREALLLAYDAGRFPGYATCNEQVQLADRHLLWVSDQQRLRPAYADGWRLYYEQVKWRRALWEILKMVQTSWLVPADRGRFNKIRLAIGEDNWRRGYLPPVVDPKLLAQIEPKKPVEKKADDKPDPAVLDRLRRINLPR